MLLNFVIQSSNNCVHHNTRDHDQSGGCWTEQKAKQLGVFTQTIILRRFNK